jgi:hypothetical protein
MIRMSVSIWLMTAALLTFPIFAAAQDNPPKPKSRTFLFSYGATVTKLKPGQKANIWIPTAPTNDYQQVTVHKKNIPGKVQQTKEELYGNQIFYTEAAANEQGEISFEIIYKVKRWEVLGDAKGEEISDALVKRFLQPDAKVPISGKPLMLVEGKKLPMDQFKLGKTFFDVVNEHMTYSKKGTGWGQGDSNWACDSKYGNCTDFHSLFISLTRAYKVPAKFDMGFGLPEKPGKGAILGYHCWAWFKPKGHGWIPVDISQASQVKKTDPKLAEFLFGNLTAARVVFTTGRDITLAPKQAGGPLNFFIYPYVEVNGEAYPAENIAKRFSYEDVDNP